MSDNVEEEKGIESEFVDEDEVEAGPAALKKLRDKLTKAVSDKQEYLDGWQRSRADFANFKRDEMGRSIEQELRLKSDTAEAIIPALDAFEMAMSSSSFISGDVNFVKGIEAVYANLRKSLEAIHITRFDPTGASFDPYKHEALREVPTDDPSKDHTVESVQRPGYAVTIPGSDERIIRPAQVSVFALVRE